MTATPDDPGRPRLEKQVLEIKSLSPGLSASLILRLSSEMKQHILNHLRGDVTLLSTEAKATVSGKVTSSHTEVTVQGK